MLLLYMESGQSPSIAAQKFHERHPDLPIPNRNVFSLLKNKLQETGSCADRPRSGRPKTATNEDIL